MEKFMYRLFICVFSIMIIRGISILFIEFNLLTLALLSVNIFVLVLIISNQRMKKKIEEYEKNSKKFC